MDMDVVIFGGGAAGLWLLDELARRGQTVVLLEANALGTGQTVAAQGIIHGGLKYTLQGIITKSATSIREMPAIWRDCLDGLREPNLSGVRRRSDSCFLWRTDSLTSRLGLLGARFGLRVAPQTVAADERPELLRGCPGTVARLPEQVISAVSFIEELAKRNRDRLLKVEREHVDFRVHGPGHVSTIRLRANSADESLETHQPDASARAPRLGPSLARPAGVNSDIELHPRCVVFTAGAGNGALRWSVGLSDEAMQRRPLHMVMLRGLLPQFQGHCVDGAKTRVTITSDVDSAGRTVWQVGGQLAEDGVALDDVSLLKIARDELLTVLPRIDLSSVEWSTYRVDRAEGRKLGGKRPETVQICREGNCLTAWPTKLALVPQLVAELCEALVPPLAPPSEGGEITADVAGKTADADAFRAWPRPDVALPPWETAARWLSDDAIANWTRPVSLPNAA